MTRRTRLALVVLLTVAIGGALWFAFHRTAAPAADVRAAAPAPSVRLAKARDGSIQMTLAAQGRVGPPAGSDAKLAFPVSGLIRSIDVHVGDDVRAGQPLVELDRSGFANAVAQAQAELAAANATFAGGATGAAAAQGAAAKLRVAIAHRNALEGGGTAAQSDRIAAESTATQAAGKVAQDRRVLERELTLFAGGVAARKDVDAARATLASDLADERAATAKVAAAGAGFRFARQQADADVAQLKSDYAAARTQSGTSGAQRDAARAKLAAAERDEANGVLAAPSDGVVVALLKHPGETVDPTTPVLDLAPPLRHDVTLTVPGADARRVHVGDAATLSHAASGARTQGRVTAVVPVIDPATQVATIVVTGVPSGAVAGEAIAATIVVGTAQGIVVPSGAVVTDPQTGRTVVFVHDGNSKETPFVSRAVEVAAANGESIVLRSGLRPGEEVAAQGAYDLLAPAGGG